MTDTTVRSPAVADGTVFAVILAVSFCHFINDIMQSLLSALYPMLKEDFRLDFWQIGLLTMAFHGDGFAAPAGRSACIPTGGRCPIRCPSAWPRR